MQAKQKSIVALFGVGAASLAVAVAIALYKGPGFNIYLVQDGSFDTPLNEWVLEDEPWIASEEIERYDAAAHCLYLRADFQPVWPQVSLSGTPFVVTVGEEKCYSGTLWSLFSSSSPSPSVGALIQKISFFGSDVLTIERNRATEIDEVRDDHRIIRALTAHGQYSAGLECTLDKAVVSQTNTSATCTYTYTLRNRDRSSLYVLDPDRLGSAGFHYFTNGPRLVSVSAGSHYSTTERRLGSVSADKPSTSSPPGALGEVDEAWLSLLRSGESMSRTVVLGGYPVPPPGTYDCVFVFSSPIRVSKDRRKLSHGNLWVGKLETSTVVNVVVGVDVEVPVHRREEATSTRKGGTQKK